nr:IDEAL domain-containing protein [Neobacillus sp. Marseille-Q6967]
MLSNNQFSIFEIGDWIKGESRNGELIIGYIESISNLEGVVKVTVVRCDNEEIIGKTIPLLSKQVKLLPAANVTNKEQILFLIDVALSTGDKEWFNELTTKLNSMRQLVIDVKAQKDNHFGETKAGGMRRF